MGRVEAQPADAFDFGLSVSRSQNGERSYQGRSGRSGYGAAKVDHWRTRERDVTMTGATGPAPAQGNIAAAVTAKLTDQTDLEMLEGRRQAERRAARLGISPKTNGATPAAPFPAGETIDTGIVEAATQRPVPAAPQQTNGAPNAIPFSRNPTTNLDHVLIHAGIAEAGRAKELQNQNRKSNEQRGQQPKPASDLATDGAASPLIFDHAMALQFYNALGLSAFVLGFTHGWSITSSEEFQTLTKEADKKHEHLFFHVATVKPTWTSGTTATKDQILECPYLWGDCDAEKYTGNDPAAAAKHYENEGSRVRTAVDKGLHALGIIPFAVWRSGAG